MEIPKHDFNSLPLTRWFPGHMNKATRKINEVLKIIDLVVEICDARIPGSSRNPSFDQLFERKPRFVVFNKADLADPSMTGLWKAWYGRRGIRVAPVSAITGKGVAALVGEWRAAYMANPRQADIGKPLSHPLRVMISGVPNVGKSTLINHLAAKHSAAVGPNPGVTRINQWIPLKGGVELLDTPGILWPTLSDKTHELRLAICGCIRDPVIGNELLGEFLWYELARQNNPVQWDLYGLDHCPESCGELMQAIATRRGMLLQGGEVDLERSSTTLIRDFRDGKLGRFTFERPDERKAVVAEAPHEDAASDDAPPDES
jgi:ribosome biogenesis GTPase A